jgi:hypothetical protein
MLDRALYLEQKGILGEGLMLSKQEKEKAKAVATATIHLTNYGNITGITGVASGQARVENQQNTFSGLTPSEILKSVASGVAAM